MESAFFICTKEVVPAKKKQSKGSTSPGVNEEEQEVFQVCGSNT